MRSKRFLLWLLSLLSVVMLLSACVSSEDVPYGDNDAADGDRSEIDWIWTDGDTPDGDVTDGDTDGDEPDGDADGDLPDGDKTDGDTDADMDVDEDGDEDGDEPDGDLPDGAKISLPAQVVFDPSELNRTISANLSIRNTGTADLIVTEVAYRSGCTDEFGISTQIGSGLTVAPGGTQMVVLTYRMKDPGLDECTLLITNNDPAQSLASVQVSSTYSGSPNVNVVPGSIDFGQWDVLDSESTTRSISFTHIAQPGSNALLVLGPFSFEDDQTPFSFSDDFNPTEVHYLNPGQSLYFDIAFKPTAKQSYATRLLFDTNDETLSRNQGGVALVGVGVAAEMTPDPDRLEFGVKPVGISTERVLTLHNGGQANAYIETVMIIDDDDGDFSYTPGTFINVPIPPGQDVLIPVQYQPTNLGTDVARLRIIGRNFFNGNQVDIELTGQGIAPSWDVSTNQLAFGAVPVFTSTSQTVTVINTSSSTLQVTDLFVNGDSEFYLSQADLDLLPVTLTPGDATFVVTVNFLPLGTALRNASLQIVTDDELVPQRDVSLSGQGAAPNISIARSDGEPFNNELYFGMVRIGDSAAIELTVGNSGSIDLDISEISIEQAGTPDFEADASTLTVAQGTTETLTVTYAPARPPATDNAELVLKTNDPDDREIRIALGGVAIEPEIGISPLTSDAEPYDFGKRFASETSSYGPREFVITNTGTGPLTIESIAFEEHFGTGFRVEFPDAELPFDIDPQSAGNESFRFHVYFEPREGIAYNGRITISSSDIQTPTLYAWLAGEGDDCPEGLHDPDNSGSCWYACDYTEGGVEVCDDVDNDCDAQTDEDYQVGEPCDGVGECAMGIIECHPENNQFTVCSTDPLGSDYPDPAPVELCDAKDNDCDGQTDEGFPLNDACEGEGACGAGVIECDPNDSSATMCSTNPGGSQDQAAPNDRCNGLDDDCDGETDEDFPQLGEACDGVGECGAGTLQCNPSNPAATICSTDPLGEDYPDPAPVEKCNNLDDDCDGATDEDIDVGDSCDPPGACGPGVLECDPQGSGGTICSTGPGGSAYDGVAERCDTVDNDCDGVTDEDFQLGQSCPAVGACGAGVWECHPSLPRERVCSTGPSGSADMSTAEVCDGLDNNCDGVTDEGLGVGDGCDGVGECGSGTKECDPNDSAKLICSTDPGGSASQAGTEVCNGLDDDCDGHTDEDFNIGQACQGAGSSCVDGHLECASQSTTRCSTDEGGSDWPTPMEVCDGIDNNCNDQTDEGFNVGNSCVAPGECGPGLYECDPDNEMGVICNTEAGGSNDQSAPEICNGRDDDCDWQTDEDFEIGQGCDGIGECGLGTYECATTSTRRCSTEPNGADDQSAAEICDGKDNDCDGLIDEDFNVGDTCNGIGACGEGFVECHPTDTSRAVCSTDRDGSQYVAVAESCNGIDDDCDAQTDEDFMVGAACVGTGECGQGVWECNGLQARRCSTNPGGRDDESTPELCDELDNDCDGNTDEDFSVGAGCEGVGACGEGTYECLNVSSSVCSTDIGGSAYPTPAPVEQCNGIDDDCDNKTDEDFDLDAACDGQGVCGPGVTECNAEGGLRCSTDFGGSDYPSTPYVELCDGLDNDCDGMTDEDFDIGGLCSGTGVCGDGVWECDPNDNTARICSTHFGGSEWEGQAELCDNQDNDCDSVTDEDFGVGQECDGAGECGLGTYECHATDTSRAVCSTEPGGSTPQDSNETCDNLDNDCDGQTDEDFNIGAVCDGEGACGEGTVECADSVSTRCSTEAGGSEDQSSEELCDTVDNNCDGQTDEGFNLGEPCNGEGECGEGVLECTPEGHQVCSTEPGGSLYPDPAPVELCDQLDNNCDGQTDEGLGAGEQCFGLGECADDEGVTECGPNQEIICSTSFGGTAWAGTDEVCDTVFETGEPIDNDCDGQANEDWDFGEDCAGTGECLTEIGTFICMGPNAAICSVDAPWHVDYAGTAESCNSLDDDCDGETDETFLSLGEQCDGIGECGTGVYVCDPNYPMSIICSTDPDGPDYNGGTETCNGEDDDCDAQIDEDWEIGLVCNGRGQCATAFGAWVCNGSDDRLCSTDVQGHADYAGVAEVCNYLDDDCDGNTDEDWPTLGDSCTIDGACGPGYIECNTHVDPACTAAIYCSKDPDCGSQREGAYEVCNGIDDDCNGCTDDGFTHDGSCVAYTCQGVGECSDGVLECSGLQNTRCSTNPGGSAYAGSPEICDGLDNDCDGQTDEDFGIGLVCDGVGECGPGLWECDPNDSSKRLCSTDIGGSEYPDPAPAEVCNGLDDDCNGETDEGFDLGEDCIGMGVCGEGELECNGMGGVRCSSEFGGSAYQGSSEICDDLDNDCDGNIDEGFGVYDLQTGERMACVGTGGCGAGVMECLNTTTAICCADVGGSCHDPTPEVCDGFDNDCNESIDELWPELGDSCEGVGMCGVGTYECRSDGTGSQCSTDLDGTEYNGDLEVCDGVDNDCDGFVDETFGVGNDFPCDGLGECGAGYYECDPTDPNEQRRICSTDLIGSAYDGTPEICDGLDNDCDGQTDEGFHIGEICDGTGECRLGVYECDGTDAYRCSTNPGSSDDDSVAELCDGKDNDCDGQTDEDFIGLGETCQAPGPCGSGQLECDSDFSLRCSTAFGGSEYAGSAETCDNVDNDCDGSTDEDFEVGDACCTVAGECGECGGPGLSGEWECAGLSARRCSVAYQGSASQSQPESCDGLDNDCDGSTDEGFGVGGVCNGVGACGEGVVECTQSGQVVCSTDVGGSEDQSTAELCDNLDNNCNGATDESFNINQPCQGEGECGAGVVECASPTAARCSTDEGGSDYSAVQETCDGLDNDCDGLTDEDFFASPTCTGRGECGAGTWICTDGYTAVCSSQLPGHQDYDGSPEICDGLDNDCDGQTDEDMNLGAVCEGIGGCGEGVLECGPGNVPMCSTDIGGSQDGSGSEVCDGVDNDCDGVTDEGFNLGESCSGNGDCGQGFWECDCPPGENLCGSSTSRCSTDFGGSEYVGGTEVCDYRDNDCDGLTDENWTLDLPCDGVGQCGLGTVECNFGQPSTICSTDIGGSEYGGIPEQCNDLDDDCDGSTDEDFLVGDACDGVGECGQGVYECNGTFAFICSTDRGGSNSQDVSETCDGKDNDCDGATDENFPNKGQSCFGVGECGEGVYECAGPLTLRCSVDPGGSDYNGNVELCNGQDDDCDGQTDEDYKCNPANDPECDDHQYLAESCDGQGACGTGLYECSSLYTLRCDHDFGGTFYDGSAEVCDGIDNDCDMQTDEDFEIGRPCVGIGACGLGTRECDPNNAANTICSTDVGGSEYPDPAPAESCNGIDDDCDGFTDEDWPSLGDICQGAGGCGEGFGKIECKSDGTGIICSTSFGGSDYSGGVETCDGVDNNCDTQTDEGFNLGGACSGIGQCGLGALECDPNDDLGTICSTMPGGSASEATQEICDGVDNNCNGSTDEYWTTLGDFCMGVGACGQGTIECNGNYSVICSTAIGGSEYPDPAPSEICNGIDDDCDGVTDEGFFIGELCEGEGGCGRGVIECATESTTRCSASQGGSDYTPIAEICDGLDNDCDGETDEGFTLGEVCSAAGICGDGVTECDGTGLATRCSTAPGGSESPAIAELCDGLDNDCDGQIDEGFGIYPHPDQWTQNGCTYDGNCSEGEVCIVSEGICIQANTCTGIGTCGSGTLECASVQSVICSSSQGGSDYVGVGEMCNGLDDDCDGQTDEDFRLPAPWSTCSGSDCGGPLATACTGLGECGNGTWECATDGQRTRCSTRTYTDGRGTGTEYGAVTEKCNGLDDDCDDQIDEDFNLGVVCPGEGVCEDGVIECATLTSTRCSTMPGGSMSMAGPELCDELDNNCNGSTDEGYRLGESCDGEGECGDGVIECSGLYQSHCSTEPGGSEYSPQPELCDLMDNDCDGQTDELYPQLGQVCVAPGDCGTGTYVCNHEGSGIECTALMNGTDELCDGLDNNCDGQTDEDFMLGIGCLGVGACGPGVYECDPTDPNRRDRMCSSDIGGSDYGGRGELCDYLDNDCDGLTDEDFKDGNGNYNSDDHCGACNTSCSFTHAEAMCVDSQCVMGDCESNWSDVDDDSSNGCECALTYTGAAVCGEAVEMPGGELTDISGGELTNTEGQVTTLDGEMWFTFFARDTEDDFCDLFKLHVWLAYNPGNAFVLDVYRDGCDSANLVCDTTEQFTFSTDGTVAAPAGECPCLPSAGEIVDEEIRTYENYCEDQSSRYYVRVKYADDVTTPVCNTFIIQATNAR